LRTTIAVPRRIERIQTKIKASWQITAGRCDPGAQLHPFHAKVDKRPEERGAYLDPKVCGQPPGNGSDRLREETPVNPGE